MPDSQLLHRWIDPVAAGMWDEQDGLVAASKCLHCNRYEDDEFHTGNAATGKAKFLANTEAFRMRIQGNRWIPVVYWNKYTAVAKWVISKPEQRWNNEHAYSKDVAIWDKEIHLKTPRRVEVLDLTDGHLYSIEYDDWLDHVHINHDAAHGSQYFIHAKWFNRKDFCDPLPGIEPHEQGAMEMETNHAQ